MELFRLLGRIVVDNTNANNAIEDTTNRANGSAKETENAFAKIGSVAGTFAKSLGTAGMAIGGAWLVAIEGTREYRAEMGLLDSAFETSGHSSKVAKETYSDLNAVMRDSGAAVEASQHLALVADNEEELNEATHTLTGVYATFGASLPLEGLAEAINHSASLGEVQGSLADALEWSGITVDDFNAQLAECTTEEERQDLIMKTLKDTYSEAADQYKETNNDVMDAEKAQEKLTDAMAELGAVGEPILTIIKEKVAEMVSAAVPMIQSFIDKIKDCIKWIKDNETTVDAWVSVIIGATVSIGSFLLVLSWGSIMATAKKAIQGVTLAVKAFNLALKSNPIGLIVSLIAGLVAAFIYLWNECDAFREFWINLWKKIKDILKPVLDWMKDAFKATWDAIKKVWSVVKGFFSYVWKGIKNVFSGIVGWFKDIWQKVTNAINTVISPWVEIFKRAWKLIKEAFQPAVNWFKGIWSGIKNAFSSVGSWFGNIFRTAWNGIKSAFGGIVSWMRGIWNDIKSVFSNVTSWFRNIFGTAFGYVKDIIIKAFQAGGKIFNGIKSGLERTFKSLVNTIIRGINTIIASPLKAVNAILKKIKNISILKIKPFTWVNTFDIPKIPKLEEGGVLEKGQVGLLEGSGKEAVVPLEKNTGWMDGIASRISKSISFDERKINRIIALLEQLLDMNIYLDSGVLVGELAPSIDSKLGVMYKHSKRNNTR